MRVVTHHTARIAEIIDRASTISMCSGHPNADTRYTFRHPVIEAMLRCRDERIEFLEAHRDVLQSKTTELLARARKAEAYAASLEHEVREEIGKLTMMLVARKP